jgi:hypothetical protein
LLRIAKIQVAHEVTDSRAAMLESFSFTHMPTVSLFSFHSVPAECPVRRLSGCLLLWLLGEGDHATSQNHSHNSE